MGALTSAIVEETYIQNIKHKQIYPKLIKHKIIVHYRYVNNILLINDKKETNIDKTLIVFNKQQLNMKLNIEI
jgi:hypothetical protein